MSIAELDGLSALEADILTAQTLLNDLGGQAIRYRALDTQHFVEGMVSEQAEQLRVRDEAHVYTEGVDSVTYATSGGTADRTVFGDPAAGYAGPTSLLSVSWDPDGGLQGLPGAGQRRAGLVDPRRAGQQPVRKSVGGSVHPGSPRGDVVHASPRGAQRLDVRPRDPTYRLRHHGTH